LTRNYPCRAAPEIVGAVVYDDWCPGASCHGCGDELMSELEALLAFQLKVLRVTAPVTEYRFDLAWVDRKIAVEAEGGTWSGGRHTTGTGFAKDCEKHNAAALAGWIVLRYVGDQVEDGTAAQQIAEVLAQHPVGVGPS
jgi:very-short-patch-repair endonuclease